MFKNILERVKGHGDSIIVSAIILATINLLVYGNTLFNGFVYDDHFQILGNPWIISRHYLYNIYSTNVWAFNGEVSPFYRPLFHTINLINYQFYGTTPWGYHATSIILHTSVSVLVLLVADAVIRKLEPSLYQYKTPPLFVAILFAVHPIHTESVAWL